MKNFTPTFSFALTEAEANLVLEALGNMPYVRVASLVAMIRSQAEAQLNAPEEAASAPVNVTSHNQSGGVTCAVAGEAP